MEQGEVLRGRMIVRYLVLVSTSLLLYMGYEYARKIVAEGDVMVADAAYPLLLEKKLFGEPLTALMAKVRSQALSIVPTIVYSLHPAYFLLYLFYLAARDEKLYHAGQLSLVFSSITAILFYALHPTAPPWMVLPTIDRPRNPLLEAVEELTGAHIDPNPYAAFPSMHVAIAVIAAELLRGRYGAKAYIWPFLMSFSTIYTANHYLLDVMAGWLLGYLSYRTAASIIEHYGANSKLNIKTSALVIRG